MPKWQAQEGEGEQRALQSMLNPLDFDISSQNILLSHLMTRLINMCNKVWLQLFPSVNQALSQCSVDTWPPELPLSF